MQIQKSLNGEIEDEEVKKEEHKDILKKRFS